MVERRRRRRNKKLDQTEIRKTLQTWAKEGENCECADCSASNPTWASATLGIYVCIRCAGIHRSLGTHISFVQSITIDNWKNPKHFDIMKRVGNFRARQYYEARKPFGIKKPNHFDPDTHIKQYIHDKYLFKKWIYPKLPPPHLEESPEVYPPLNIENNQKKEEQKKDKKTKQNKKLTKAEERKKKRKKKKLLQQKKLQQQQKQQEEQLQHQQEQLLLINQNNDDDNDNFFQEGGSKLERRKSSSYIDGVIENKNRNQEIESIEKTITEKVKKHDEKIKEKRKKKAKQQCLIQINGDNDEEESDFDESDSDSDSDSENNEEEIIKKIEKSRSDSIHRRTKSYNVAQTKENRLVYQFDDFLQTIENKNNNKINNNNNNILDFTNDTTDMFQGLTLSSNTIKSNLNQKNNQINQIFPQHQNQKSNIQNFNNSLPNNSNNISFFQNNNNTKNENNKKNNLFEGFDLKINTKNKILKNEDPKTAPSILVNSENIFEKSKPYTIANSPSHQIKYYNPYGNVEDDEDTEDEEEDDDDEIFQIKKKKKTKEVKKREKESKKKRKNILSLFNENKQPVIHHVIPNQNGGIKFWQ